MRIAKKLNVRKKQFEDRKQSECVHITYIYTVRLCDYRMGFPMIIIRFGKLNIKVVYTVCAFNM